MIGMKWQNFISTAFKTRRPWKCMHKHLLLILICILNIAWVNVRRKGIKRIDSTQHTIWMQTKNIKAMNLQQESVWLKGGRKSILFLELNARSKIYERSRSMHKSRTFHTNKAFHALRLSCASTGWYGQVYTHTWLLPLAIAPAAMRMLMRMNIVWKRFKSN